MSPAFLRALEFTLKWEGGYSNHPNDRGGATNYGITQRFARAKGWTGDMRHLPLDLATKWYHESIWQRYKLEEVAREAEKPAGYLFDMAVNHGRWARVAQQAAARYSGLTIDGAWGPQTHAAFIRAAGVKGGTPFLDALKVERCDYGEWIVSNDRKAEVFLLGWLRRWLA